MRSGQGTGKTTTSSITIGDVIFMGMVDLSSHFIRIKDTHGLTRITKSVKKQATQIEKQLKKMEKDGEKRKTAKGTVTCQKCENPNLQNANFCSHSGIPLK
jgi:hypothetical protein